jgi:hypothetical protein
VRFARLGPGGRLLTGLVVGLVVLVLVGIGVGAVDPGAGSAGEDRSADAVAHTDPDTVSDEGDLSALERQLANRLAQRARSGSLNLSPEQASRARRIANDSRYRSLLEQYSEIAAQTGNEERAETYRRLQNDQVAFATSVDRYWVTYDRYRAAKMGVPPGVIERGTVVLWGRNVTTATTPRRLARGLERHWRQANESQRDLIRNYQRLARDSPRDFERETTSINRTMANLTETQRAVRREAFVETTLTVTPRRANVSFEDPLQLRGRLRAENGSAIGTERASVRIANRSVPIRTDEDGRFEATYRPSTLPLNTTSVDVEFVPADGSVYLNASARVAVSVTQVEPNVSISRRPGTVAYNDTIRIDGWVGTDRAGAGNLTYFLTLDGRFLTRNETNATGRFRNTVSLPAGIETGRQPIAVIVPLEDRALAPVEASTNVTVERTATTLSIDVSRVEDAVRVEGAFGTVDGEPVPGRDVSLAANGTLLGSATTGHAGRFQQTLSVPNRVRSGGPLGGETTLSIQARFDGSGTNLGSADARESVSLIGSVDWRTPAGVVVLLVLVVGGVLAYTRRPFGIGRSADGANEQTTLDRTLGAEERASIAEDAEALARFARSQLEAGQTESAIQAGYLAARRRLEARLGESTSETHWEFYQHCRDAAIDEESLNGLRRLTEHYERVAFAAESVGTETATDVLETMRRLVDETRAVGSSDE